MRKSTLVILLVAALLVTGITAGGGKALSGLNAVIDKYKEPDIKLEIPEEPETVIKYLSASNSGVGFTTALVDGSDISYMYYKTETPVVVDEHSAIVVRYDVSSTPLSWTGPSIWHGLLSHEYVASGFVDFGVKVTMSEGAFGGDFTSVRYGTSNKSIDSFDSLTYVFVRNDDGADLYVYVNDEFLTTIAVSDIPEKLYGVYVGFDADGTDIMYDSIELYGFSTDYSGDLYDVLLGNAPLTDSEDFNTIINGSNAE